MAKWIYAVYKGEDFITEGTKEEICDYMEIKPATFEYYRTKEWARRCGNGDDHTTIIRIDNIDEE